MLDLLISILENATNKAQLDRSLKSPNGQALASFQVYLVIIIYCKLTRYAYMDFLGPVILLRLTYARNNWEGSDAFLNQRKYARLFPSPKGLKSVRKFDNCAILYTVYKVLYKFLIILIKLKETVKIEKELYWTVRPPPLWLQANYMRINFSGLCYKRPSLCNIFKRSPVSRTFFECQGRRALERACVRPSAPFFIERGVKRRILGIISPAATPSSSSSSKGSITIYQTSLLDGRAPATSAPLFRNMVGLK